MNVLLLTPYLYQNKGPFVWARSFAQHLCEHDTNVFVLSFNEKEINHTGFHLFRHDGYRLEKKIMKYPFLSIIRQVILLEKKYRIDVIQTNDPILGFVALLAKKITNVPVVLRMGGEYFNEINEQSIKQCERIFGKDIKILSRSLSFFLKSIGLYSLKRVDMVIALNEYMKEYLKHYGLDSHIIPNAIDTTKYNLDTVPMCEGSILTISHMTIPKKAHGIKILLNSMCILKNDIDVKLKIAGDGTYKRSLEKYAAELGIASNVEFLGNRDDIPYLLSECYMYVHPSLQDIFPNAILEAMASKKPVISTNIGGIPEIIRNNYNGVLCEPNAEELARSIYKIFKERSLRKKIIQNGYATVNEVYKWDTVIDSYLSIYSNLIRTPVNDDINECGAHK